MMHSKKHFILLAVFFSITAVLLAQTTPTENNGKTAIGKYITEVLDPKVREEQRTTDKLTEESLADLPVGIVQTIGGNVIVICIDSAYWNGDGDSNGNGRGWFLSAYASIQLPGTSEKLAFAAKHVGFTGGGLSLSNTKLMLVSQHKIPLGDHVTLEVPNDGRNYVEFDCDGFKSINLKGIFSFDNEIIIPADGTDKNVTASFEVNATDLSNMMMEVNINQSFTTPKLKEHIVFNVQKAFADLSDLVNPQGFALPQGYPDAGEGNLWKGFYLEKLSARLVSFSGSNNSNAQNNMGNKETRSIEFGVEKMIIDDLGFSGAIFAENILTFTESSDNNSSNGNSSSTSSNGHATKSKKWPMSVAKFSLELVANDVEGGKLEGQIGVPALGKEPFKYTGEMQEINDQINFKFLVEVGNKKRNTAFGTIELLPSSTITVERKEGNYSASAVLHGSLSVSGEIAATGLKFENWKLMSESPYMVAPNFSMLPSGQPKAGGFPIKIEDIGLEMKEDIAHLGFGVALNLTGKVGIYAKTNVAIMVNTEDWDYKGTRFNAIKLNSNTGAVSLTGEMERFREDPTYGSGFRGKLALGIKNVMPQLEASANFGNKSSYSYGHVDVRAPFVNIPVAGPFVIDGIVGGFSYNMISKDKLQIGAQSLEDWNNRKENVFVPDSTAGIAFMAGVTYRVASEKACHGEAILDVALNPQTYGLRYVQFKGSAYFLTDKQIGKQPANEEKAPAPFYANLDVRLDLTTGKTVFHANLTTYLYLKGGVLKGTGPNNKLGEATIHAGDKFYIKIGVPKIPLRIDIAHITVVDGYFMMGKDLEDPEPLPFEAASILGGLDPSLARDQDMLQTGKGIAAGIRYQTGDEITAGPIHVKLKVGAGADFMIRNFGNTFCAGSDGKIGFDGKYGSGQLYAFMSGKVSVAKIDVLNLGAAALGRFKAPDPSWAELKLAGKYSFAGGLVTGRFKLTYIKGKQCELVTQTSQASEVVVISDIAPTGSDVSVFSHVQVSFNAPINTQFATLDADDKKTIYQIKFDEFSLKNNGQLIAGNPKWNAKNDVLTFETPETLPPNTTINVYAKVHWEKKENNGTWAPIQENGQIKYEIKESQFTTGAAPDFIPEENVAYSYPVKNQYNFYSKELASNSNFANEGYLKLRKGQSYLFQSAENEKWKYFARFKTTSGTVMETPLRYSGTDATVYFALPEELKTGTVYKLTFVKQPEVSEDSESNVKREQITVGAGTDNEMKMASNKLEGTVQSGEKDIYNAIDFRTSIYATFKEKLKAITNTEHRFDITGGNLAVLAKVGTLNETFDEYELKGYPNRTNALIQTIATTDNNWFTNDINPLLYQDNSLSITNRDINVLGRQPLKAVRLSTMDGNYTLSETNATSGTSFPKSGQIKLLYYPSPIVAMDYVDLRNQAASMAISGNSSPAISRLLASTGYVDMRPNADYIVKIMHVLPGSEKVTHEETTNIHF